VSDVMVAGPALALGTATSITLATTMSAAARTALLITSYPPGRLAQLIRRYVRNGGSCNFECPRLARSRYFRA